jgi:hypothetical protein
MPRVNAQIAIDELDRNYLIEYEDEQQIHIFHHKFSLFISEDAFNELIQLVQQSQREKKAVRPHREMMEEAHVSLT